MKQVLFGMTLGTLVQVTLWVAVSTAVAGPGSIHSTPPAEADFVSRDCGPGWKVYD